MIPHATPPHTLTARVPRHPGGTPLPQSDDLGHRGGQGRETLINKLLVGLNQNQFISIEWIDTREIPLEEEKAFSVK